MWLRNKAGLFLVFDANYYYYSDYREHITIKYYNMFEQIRNFWVLQGESFRVDKLSPKVIAISTLGKLHVFRVWLLIQIIQITSM